LERSAAALSEAHGHLDRIRQRLEEGHRGLYHDLALYLQVLREGLLAAVQQAVFHLAIQVAPERYQQLSDGQRQDLPRRLEQLVHRCGCLLTLEQLLVLARQVQAEQWRLRHIDQRRLAQALTQGSPGDDTDASDHGPEADEDPAGSIRLDLHLPLSADLFSGGLPGLAGLGNLLADPGTEQDPDLDEDQDEDAPSMDLDHDDAADDSQDGDTGENGSDDPTDILQALLGLAAQEGLRARPDQAPGDREGGETTGARSAAAADRSGLVPNQPLELLEWWGALDRALQRRLRNLSHAINLELIKLGLIRSLLPVSLLDAVLQGQVDPLPGPANLLRLHLPFTTPDAAVQLEAMGVLLRTSDLEYEQPRLRVCRKQLERRRGDVRKMAQQYRHWLRRARALEAERQWMHDSQSNPQAPV
jgi:hypothetical protein